MTGYTKLFASILDSTIWDEDCATRILWITMLAMVNRDSQVLTSVKNLSLRARLTVNDVNESLEKLLAPDPESKSREHEGRRIVKIDGGWQILNYERYRNKRDRASYMRNYMRNYRAVNQNGDSKVNPSVSHSKPQLADSISIKHIYNPPIIPPLKVNSVNNQNQEFQTQELKNHPQRCLMPECNGRRRTGLPGYAALFCSEACYERAKTLDPNSIK